jgi:type II secretory pathway component PulF
MMNRFSQWQDRFARFMFYINESNRLRLWRKLGKMINDGFPLLQAIEELRNRRKARRGEQHEEVVALSAWLQALNNGKRLSVAIQGWVSKEEELLILSGDESGSLDIALESVVSLMLAKRKITAAIRSGITYPGFLFALAFVVVYFFGFKIIPSFTRVVPNNTWYGMAHALILFCDFSRNWLWLVFSLVVGTIALFFYSLPRWDGALRSKLDRHAPYSIYRMQQGSSWLIGMAALVRGGVRMETAMEKVSSGATPWLKRRVIAALRSMRTGLPLGEALAATGYEFPDPEIIDDLVIYTRKSGSEESIKTLGEEWIVQAVEEIKLKMAIVFAGALFLVGSIIIFNVGGMISMQLQLQQSISQGYSAQPQPPHP